MIRCVDADVKIQINREGAKSAKELKNDNP
jgi:hypothetical protein